MAKTRPGMVYPRPVELSTADPTSARINEIISQVKEEMRIAALGPIPPLSFLDHRVKDAP